MSFKVGETVVYPHHGAALIEAIETRTIKGEEKIYLVLKVAQGDRGAGEWPDQGNQGPTPLPVAGFGEGGCGMAPDRRDAQPAQTVPVQAIPAGSGTGHRVKGHGPGTSSQS